MVTHVEIYIQIVSVFYFLHSRQNMVTSRSYVFIYVSNAFISLVKTVVNGRSSAKLTVTTTWSAWWIPLGRTMSFGPVRGFGFGD